MGYTCRRASIGTVIYNLKSNLSPHGTVYNTTNTPKPIGYKKKKWVEEAGAHDSHYDVFLKPFRIEWMLLKAS